MIEALHEALRSDRREPDGLLHCSGDLIGSLRHAQLRAAGAPTEASELVSDIRLRTGTMWHEYIAQSRIGIPFMSEVNVTPWLPEGWAGTVDSVKFEDAHRAFVPEDYKTIKGEGMRWVERDGIKEMHLWQLSAYWYALKKMGLPRLMKIVRVLYLPMNNVPRDTVEPLILEAKPLPEAQVLGVMEHRWNMTRDYLSLVDQVRPENFGGRLARHYIRKPENEHLIYLNKHLAPPIEREHKVFWNARQKVFDVKLSPHWLTRYCPYPNELCDCSEQGYTKIGHWESTSEPNEGLRWAPRTGYESTKASEVPLPDRKDVKKRLKETT